MSFVFSGTADECLADYLSRFPSDQHLQILAEYIGMKEIRVRDVKRRGIRLTGEKLLRAEVFLDLIGYHVKEFQELHPDVRKFAQSIALGIISLHKAAEVLDYPNVTGVLSVTLRGGGMYQKKQYRLQRFVEKAQDVLANNLAAEHQHLGKFFPEAKARPEARAVTTPCPASDRTKRAQPRKSGASAKQALQPVVVVQPLQQIVAQLPLNVALVLVHQLVATAELMFWANQQPNSSEVWPFLRDLVSPDRIQTLSDFIAHMKGEATQS